MDSTWRNRLLYIAGAFAVLLLWQGASWMVGLPIILPGPVATLGRLLQLVPSREFLGALGATIGRGCVGFLLSTAVGVVLGCAAGLSEGVARFLEPTVSVVRATPVISVILLALIWFRVDSVPVYVAFLMTFPVLYGNVVEGIRSTSSELLEMGTIYGVSRTRVLREIYLPSLAPFVVAAFSNTLGLTWKVVVAAEVLSQPERALGTRLYEAKLQLDTAAVLAWTVVAILLAALSERTLRAAQRRLIAWGPP
jgi:NitT/TauT family transport system permease protein